MQFYFLAWKQSLHFSGRSSKKAFWLFILIHTFVTIGCIVADIMMDMTTWFDAIYGVISFIPMLSAIVRRLHDINKSGYWGFIFFIPIIGQFWLLYLLAQSSNSLENEAAFA